MFSIPVVAHRLVPRPDYVRVEQKRGVRLGDMLDALRGVVAGDEASWWFDMFPPENEDDDYGWINDDKISDKCKFVEFEITMFWKYA
jgi:hypothetical protein